MFCAGGDIRSMAGAANHNDGAAWRSRMHGTQRWMAEPLPFDKPVIAAVDGPAFGAGSASH